MTSNTQNPSTPAQNPNAGLYAFNVRMTKLESNSLTLRDAFFVTKILALRCDTYISHLDKDIKIYQRALQRYDKTPASHRLAKAQLIQTIRHNLNRLQPIKKEFNDIRDIFKGILFDCMSKDSLAPTWHTVAQCLGISHVALHGFLEEHRTIITDSPSVLHAAFFHAEVCGEPQDDFIHSTNARNILLFRATTKGIIESINENPVMKYRFSKEFSKLFGGDFPTPKPVRNFTIVGA